MTIKPVRALFNLLANHATWQGRHLLHAAFSRSMTQGMPGWRDTDWPVTFAGRTFLAPLRRDNLYLDWVAALSFLGHDTDEKRSYSAIVRSAAKPTVFLDVGGNYGTCSLLMMSQGIETFYFEPNPTCHGYLEAASRRNGFTPHIEPVALGSAPGSIILSYPKNETWLGSTNAAVTATLRDTDLVTHEVEMRTLDSYLTTIPPGPIVMKMDAEGSELAILYGARALLVERKPIMMFEAHSNVGERVAMWDFLDQAGYDVTLHVWPQPSLTRAVFVQVSNHNFLAVPRTA